MATNDMENIRKKAFMSCTVQLYMPKSLQNTKINKSYKVIYSGQNKGYTLSENFKTPVLSSTSRIKFPFSKWEQ